MGPHPRTVGRAEILRADRLRGVAGLALTGDDARKIQQGKRDNPAPVTLARRRCGDLIVRLRDGLFINPSAP
jgi:hypothetical protein